jgi:hypothetical protein
MLDGRAIGMLNMRGWTKRDIKMQWAYRLRLSCGQGHNTEDKELGNEG